MSKKSKNEEEQLWEIEKIVDKRYYKKNNELHRRTILFSRRKNK